MNLEKTLSRIHTLIVSFRYCHGLVRSCHVVAGPEHLAGQDPVDAGPIQHHSRRRHPLHPHAQDPQGAAPRPQIHRLQRRLLNQDIQCISQPM